MSHYDASFFDREFDRRGTSSSKWDRYAGRDILPFWIADMDFAVADFIVDALKARLDHPIIGYTDKPASLTAAFVEWLETQFNWQIDPDWVVWIPGVVPGINLAGLTLDRRGAIVVPTPVYHPFLNVAGYASVAEIRAPMSNKSGRWELDLAALEAQITQDTRMLIMCNPQNPTGRCFTVDELKGLADLVDRHDLLIVSDEIHCSIVLNETSTHVPIAREFPEIAARSISLYAATKTYNIPGLGCAAAVIPDPNLRSSFLTVRSGVLPNIGPLALLASEVAFSDRSNWVAALLDYLRGNLKQVEAVTGARQATLEGTYLAWIDVADLAPTDTLAYFEGHGLGLSPGEQFGQEGYVRFNFACPRRLLDRGLERLAAALGS